ncbi:class I SAM-dependent methyltransferase [Paraferrimonas sedimenticola]|uniref:Methyltransferase n=1 Tax=Paraferrimonas sedimenticola TaxID=375674 RepID=A0AA37RXM7_9GAMM|nr:class I SAM-dependent methyltransferase [Paraferrimonas sedimenticola]GLP96542.1 methyltransferase [Paraferrimonas sedimenticola]
MKTLLSAGALVLLTSSAFAADFSDTKAKLETAMKADIRTEKEVERDRNRKPIQTLEFFGLRDDMTIVELLPGGGWYTKLLAPTVRDKGQYYMAVGTSRAQKAVDGQAGFDKVKTTADGAKVYRPEGSMFYTLEMDDLGVSNADMVLTFRNYHNFDEGGRKAMNEAAFKALKSGGVYAVVDHTRRHMQDVDSENRRRFDPVLAIKEIQEAGFVLVDFSDLHYRLDDELRYEVGRRSVSGNTDRWTIKFVKP